MATNAALVFSSAVNGATAIGTASAGTLDLNGFDQTFVSIAATSATLTSTIQNNGAGPKTLTLNTTASTSYNGTIDGGINLVVQGTGTQTLTNTNSSYTGTTTLSGTAVLAAAALIDGGSGSSIGAATNDAANLVFDGGTLRYTGASNANIDRNFTINSGKTANFDVATAATNLTLRGTTPQAVATNGGLTKLGTGTLTFDSAAVFNYTGTTTVTAGTLVVNNNLSSPTGMSIASTGKLSGTGTVAAAIIHTAGIINPGDPAQNNGIGTLNLTGALTLSGGTTQFDVDGSNIANPQDLVNASGGLTVTGPTKSTIDLEFLSLGSVPTLPFNMTLFQTGTAAISTGADTNLKFVSNGLAGRSLYAVTVTGPVGATPGTVSIAVTPKAASNVTWNSTTNSGTGLLWDVASSSDATAGTANWNNTSLGTNPDKFYSQDTVTFPDGAGLVTGITLSDTAIIGGAHFTSNTQAYTISGAGKISGVGAVDKTGGSLLTIKTNNDYSGGTTITQERSMWVVPARSDRWEPDLSLTIQILSTPGPMR